MATACSPSHCARSARAPPKSCSRRPGGARLIIRAAAARPDGAASRQQTSGSAAARQQQLVRALLQAARKQVVDGWLSDLLLPLVSGDDGAAEPAPPTQTPQALGDPDSRFVAVDGVQLHYKEALPAGSGSSSDQPAICLIHGLNGSVFSWRMMQQSLADATGCRCAGWQQLLLCPSSAPLLPCPLCAEAAHSSCSLEASRSAGCQPPANRRQPTALLPRPHRPQGDCL